MSRAIGRRGFLGGMLAMVVGGVVGRKAPARQCLRITVRGKADVDALRAMAENGVLAPDKAFLGASWNEVQAFLDRTLETNGVPSVLVRSPGPSAVSFPAPRS
jgi:hypothetical protein